MAWLLPTFDAFSGSFDYDSEDIPIDDIDDVDDTEDFKEVDPEDA